MQNLDNIKNSRKNFFIIGNDSFYRSNKDNLKKIVEIINKEKLLIISGMKNIGKLNFIKYLLSKTQVNYNYFYFNKSDDYNNLINSGQDLFSLLNEYIKLYKIPNIIILQNIEKIEGIKEFIGDIYRNKYKIILVGNNIKISGIKEIEILNDYHVNNNNLNSSILYGSLHEIGLIDRLLNFQQINNNISTINNNSKIIIPELDKFKQKYLNSTTSDILLNDILKNFGVKNIYLYNYTLSFLANNNIFYSLRELQKDINEINNISLKTVIDYVDFSIQAKIVKRVYKYDFKTKKIITSKAKYYFTDNGIRNSLGKFNVDKSILYENLIFDILEYNNYSIYSGINGKFDFTFYGERNNSLLNFLPLQGKEATEKIFIHISNNYKKEGIKKEVNKLLKLGIDGKKYLLVEDIEKLGIKKFKYDSVEIMEIESFLKFLCTK